MLGFGFGYQEMMIMAVVLLLLFGSARLPSLMRNMGRSVNEFKAGIREQPQEDPQYVGEDANAEKEAVTK